MPISISAYTQQTLDRQGVRDIQDVVRLTPGLDFNRGGPQNLTNISIRGIRSNGGASTTGIYLDDVPIQSRRVGYAGGSPFPETFDLERVEVLRGPQGTLFGAGSQGGTIRFITPQPPLSGESAYGRAEVNSVKGGGVGFEMGAAYGAALVEDKIGFRASAWTRQSAGWVDRANPRTGAIIKPDANTGDTFAGRFALTLAPAETVKLTASIYYQRQHSDDTSAYWNILSDPSQGKFINGNEIAAPTTDRFYVPSLSATIDLSDKIGLISVSSYLHRDQDIVADYTQLQRAIVFGNPIPPAGAAAPSMFHNSQRSFTQEVRLQSTASGQRLRWVLGAFYQNSKQNATQFVRDPTLESEFQAATGLPFSAVFGIPVLPGGLIYYQDPFKTVDKQIAGFGQVDFDILDKLTATVGLRVASAKFSFLTSVGGPFGGVPFTDSGKQSDSPVTPKFGLEYRFSPSNSVYASAAKGFRVGGSNARQLSPCQAQLNALGLGGINPTTYQSDSVWSYEVGSKNQTADRRLTLNASLFYVKWNNIQQFVTLSTCGGGFIANLGRAENKGFDLQAAFTPFDGLNLGASVGYTNGEFKDTVYAAAPQIGASAVSAGDRLQGSPWRIAINAEYRFALSERNEAYGRIDYQYASRESDRVAQRNPANGLNFVPFYYGAPETHFVTVRAGVKMSAFDLSVFADNLFDTKTALDGQNLVGSPLTRFSGFRPRTIGLTATARY
ncbi:outer membrane receptor protein involved in Fe transport [Novosphingobium sp. 1529]|uniref:TonB-dependent receptor n=1 Tax=Novosphingobium sp. 1529 TaxID=3156424 RepID=UPI00339AD75C